MKFVSLIAALLIIATPAAAADRLLDAAASYVFFQPSGEATVPAGNPVEDFDLTVSSDTGYGVSLSVFLGRFATELSLSQVEASLELGAADGAPVATSPRTKIMPITATFQYHFAPDAMIDPYLGVGAMYVITDDLEDVPAAGTTVTEVEGNDYGYLINAGLSLELTETLGVIIDAKYVPSAIPARVLINTPAGTETNVDLNPLMVSIGVSYRYGR